MRLVGQAMSMAVVTLVMSSYLGERAVSEAPAGLLLSAAGALFRFFAFLCFIGIFASLKRGDVERE